MNITCLNEEYNWTNTALTRKKIHFIEIWIKLLILYSYVSLISKKKKGPLKRIRRILFTKMASRHPGQCILTDFITLLDNIKEEQKGWFQRDNAKACISDSLMTLICKFFKERMISVGLWPPRSSDLSPVDFFLWGFLKDVVYVNRPTTFVILKQMIACLDINGGQFQHSLW